MGNKHKTLEISHKFNRLTVIEHAGVNKLNKTLYKVVCDCGNEKICYATELRSGHTKSCGCFRAEASSLRRTTHGATKNKKISSEFSTWCSMRQRCNDKKDSKYHRYGGRGIKVCDRWLNSFENFLLDMGEKPSKEYSIDRIDNNGNYEPNNCRWATKKQQANNTSTNKFINYNGENMTIMQASERSGIAYYTVLDRATKNKDVFNKVIRKVDKKIVLNMENGIYYDSMADAAKAHNIKQITLTKSIERKGYYKNLNNAF
jgi:hypothetical protein